MMGSRSVWIGVALFCLVGCPSDEGSGEDPQEGDGAAGGDSAAGSGAGSNASGPAGAGAAGSEGEGGSAGEAGNGSDAGGEAGGSDSCFPPCFVEAVADCMPMGACTFVWNESEGAYAECYENGVKFCGTSGLPPTPANGIVTTTDGRTRCADLEITYEGGNAHATYSKPSGEVIATIVAPADGSSRLVELTCGGATYEIDTSRRECLFGSGGIPGICETGTPADCSCN